MWGQNVVYYGMFQLSEEKGRSTGQESLQCESHLGTQAVASKLQEWLCDWNIASLNPQMVQSIWTMHFCFFTLRKKLHKYKHNKWKNNVMWAEASEPLKSVGLPHTRTYVGLLKLYLVTEFDPPVDSLLLLFWTFSSSGCRWFLAGTPSPPLSLGVLARSVCELWGDAGAD